MVRVDPITAQLEAIHHQFAGLAEGEVATYIPELARANPDYFGIAVMSLEGRSYEAGDAREAFTIQSVSKPFVFAMAIESLGLEAVLERVGVEPSGEGFNAISLDPQTGVPANPMINAGAILVTSLIEAGSPEERFERILHAMSGFAGRPLDIDEDVYRSEVETGDRNRALAYMMRNAGALRAGVEETLDTYFRQCAIRVTAVDMAAMAATLANRGVHPVTGEVVVSESTASSVLTVMATCGMYDYSGNWLLRVGLPAKSGVSGALMAASPDQFGIGLFSPRVDSLGNSVRGLAACKELSSRFEMGLLRRSGKPATAIYATGIGEMASGWTGLGAGQREDVAIRALQGDIDFADVERLLGSLATLPEGSGGDASGSVVLDMHRVVSISRAAEALLDGLVGDLIDAGYRVGIVDGPGRGMISDHASDTTLDAALRRMREHPARKDASGTSANMDDEENDNGNPERDRPPLCNG